MEVALPIAYACMLVFTAIGLVCDLKTGKLPNWLTVPTFCAGLLFHVARGFWLFGPSGALHGLLFALAGFATGFGLLLILWFVGGGGGGDVKFMGALGCWLGLVLTFKVLVVSAVFALLLTMAVASTRILRLKRTPIQQVGRGPRREGKKKNTVGSPWSRPFRQGYGWKVPFGLPVALATWTLLIAQMVVLWTRGAPMPPH